MQERRRFFRLNDEVVLDVFRISQEEYEKHCQGLIGTHSELEQLERDIVAQLHLLRTTQPAIGQVLELLNRKINLLNQDKLVTPTQLPAEKTTINLSACGASFYTDENLQDATWLLVSLQLQPANITLSIPSTLISCNQAAHENGAYLVRVDFSGIRETDQELLLQHLFQLQARQLRAQRTQ